MSEDILLDIKNPATALNELSNDDLKEILSAAQDIMQCRIDEGSWD